MASVAEIKRLELNCEIKLAYQHVKKELGEQFEDHMKYISEEIVTLQKSCQAGTSYYIAGMILTLAPDKSDVNEQNNEEFAHYTTLVKAAIGWGLVNGYADKGNPFVEEFKEFVRSGVL